MLQTQSYVYFVQVVNEDRFQMRADGSLVICDIKMTDERDYKCKIENKFGYETSKTQLFIRSKSLIISL